MPSLVGHFRIRATAREDGRTALAEQSFRAPFHLSKPYWDVDARTLHVQVVNPTAGILAGDRLESEITAGTAAALMVTTPSANRVFMMRDGTAECRQQFTVAENGWLEVSPEPLVPHRGSRYRQSTTVDVASGGALFFVDQLIPGRIGFGEAWAWTELRLELSVRLAGVLILRERFEHTGESLRALAGFAGSGPTACFANAIVIGAPADFAARCLCELNALQRDGIWIGASALRQGGWSIKVVTPDPIRLRATVAAVRQRLAMILPRLACATRKL